MAWNTKNNGRIMSEINITPLTDVMLVLLVVFMVTTPLIMSESFKVKLPKAVTSDSEPGKGVIVAVSENGLISINGKATSKEGLYDGLKNELAVTPDKILIVKADGNTRHSTVIKILDTGKLAGALKLSIATEHEERKR